MLLLVFPSERSVRYCLMQELEQQTERICSALLVR